MRKRKKWILRYVERARQTLRLWLETSEVPVGLRPAIGPATTHGFYLIYPQVASELMFHVMVRGRYCEVNILVNYRDRNWDMLLSIEVDEVRKGSYFTCRWCCLEGEKKYFPSRYQLYADHLWEPFFAWVKKNICPDKKVSIFAVSDCGSSWAEVGSLSQVADHVTTRELVHSFAIIQSPPGGAV